MEINSQRRPVLTYTKRSYTNTICMYCIMYICACSSIEACTHLYSLLCGQDHAQSASGLPWSKFCTFNFLTTPISVAFFNRISNIFKNLVKKFVIMADHTRSDSPGRIWLCVFCLRMIWPLWYEYHNLFLYVQSDRMWSRDCAWSVSGLVDHVQSKFCTLVQSTFVDIEHGLQQV